MKFTVIKTSYWRVDARDEEDALDDVSQDEGLRHAPYREDWRVEPGE